MTDDGYADAFYELAKIMNVGAQDRSPKDVWENEMLPILRDKFSDDAVQKIPHEVFIEEAQRRANLGNWSPDEYMSRHQSADRHKLGIIRKIVVDLFVRACRRNELTEDIKNAHSAMDALDAIHGNPIPNERIVPINTAFYGRDPYEDHAPKPTEETL